MFRQASYNQFVLAVRKKDGKTLNVHILTRQLKDMEFVFSSQEQYC